MSANDNFSLHDDEELSLHDDASLDDLHFARECKFKGSKEGSRHEASRGQDFKPVRTEKEALMTIDKGQINWVEQTADEELNHAQMAFTVNNSSTVKIGLGYGIQSNAEVLGYEEEMSRGIFVLRETDAGYYDIPLYKPIQKEDIDDSLYEYGKHGPQPKSPSSTVSNASSIVFSICPSNDSNEELGAVSDASSTHYSTCQSNDSDGELGTISDHSVNDDPIHDNIPILLEQVLLKVPRQHNMYTFDMKNVVSSKAYTCLLAKASSDEAKLWHRSPLGKFDGKSDEGFLVGYSVNSKAFRVYNVVTKRVEVNLHVNFLEEKPNTEEPEELMVSLLLLRKATVSILKTLLQEDSLPPKADIFYTISKNAVPATAPTSTIPVNTGSENFNTVFEEVTTGNIEAISPSADHEEEASYDDDGIITDFNNLPDEVDVTLNPTLRIHNAHPQSQILGDPNTPVQTRSSLKKITEAHALEELLQFKLQQVWVLVDLPNGAKVIVHRSNKMDVKSAFLYGTIDEEVYVSQPPGFYMALLVQSILVQRMQNQRLQGGKVKKILQDSSIQGRLPSSYNKVHASGEKQVEDISPNTLEAAKTLSKVASLKSRSIDKGRRYKRRKETKGNKVVSSLDFQDQDHDTAKKINTAGEVNAATSTSCEDKGQREGKAPMLSEETPKKSKEQILQEEASLAEAIRLDPTKRKKAKQIHLDALLAQKNSEEKRLTEQHEEEKSSSYSWMLNFTQMKRWE
ncbi:retrovirus-related pol polyprotein from transposon TNT 1-94 [Tanacetum coccineum]|uniref:Retrovirus-related pol polyprotein from transposon TNT 1-94 n=1 Tax=Tanacetum coccineum TaxID=301880 RepID=A0ABQ4X7H1_9ASTR